MISTIKEQASGLLDELRRVDWPSKDKVFSASLSVVVVSAFVGTFLWAADWVISWGMHLVLPHH